MGVRTLASQGALDGVRDVLARAADVPDVALVVATVVTPAVLVVWRLVARRTHNDLWSGLATMALAVTALAVPACQALWWDGATSGAFWWALAVAVTAAALASTEWLRTSLRGFAVLALVALTALLLRVGSGDLDDARCVEVHKLAADVTGLDKTKGELIDASTVAAAKARATLGESVRADAATPGLAAPAQRLVVALEAGDEAGRKTATAALDAAYLPNAGSRADAALVAAADKAVAAAQALDALQGVEGPATVAGLADEACGAKQRLVNNVELTGARSATATYRQSLQPTDDNEAAAEKAVAAAATAADHAVRGEADEGTDWVSVVKHGATVAGAAALGWLPGSPEPDRWFWVALAVLLLGSCWLIERRSASVVAGPVKVTFKGVELEEADKGKQPATQAQEAVFVTALTKNLREPGSTPGSQTSSPLTDLEGVVTAADPSKILTAVIAALKKVLSSPRGSLVSAQVLAPLPGDKRWRVFVVVADAATGTTVASKEIADESGAEACRVAGYWASASVLSVSPRMPLWARWSPATAHAFAAYDTASEPTIDALRAALREAPASSLVLHKLADQLSLEGKYADAAELYARAVVVDPTDHTSLYRLAAALATLARPAAEGDPAPWCELGYSRRAAAAELVNRAARRAQANGEVPTTSDATPAQQCTALAGLSGALLERLYDTLRPRSVALRYFRRDQRDAIGPLSDVFSKYGRAAQSRAALRAAGLSVGGFGSQSDALKKTEAFARDSRSGWQVCYNLACYYAGQEGDGVEKAIAQLETALTRPGVEELAGAWLEKDPDLEALRAHPRFKLLRNSFASQLKES